MSEMITSDRRASWQEIASQRDELRTCAQRYRLTRIRLAGDGTVIVHSSDPGYRSVGRFAAEAARIVGTYVHVITDDVPAAESDTPKL